MSKNCTLWPSGLRVCLKCLCFGEWIFSMLSVQSKLMSCCHAILQIQCKLYCDGGSDAWHVGSVIECKSTWYVLDWSGFSHWANPHSVWWSFFDRTHSNSTNTLWMINLVLNCTMLCHVWVPYFLLWYQQQSCFFHFIFLPCYPLVLLVRTSEHVLILCSIKSEAHWFLLIDSWTRDTFIWKRELVWKMCAAIRTCLGLSQQHQHILLNFYWTCVYQS